MLDCTSFKPPAYCLAGSINASILSSIKILANKFTVHLVGPKDEYVKMFYGTWTNFFNVDFDIVPQIESDAAILILLTATGPEIEQFVKSKLLCPKIIIDTELDSVYRLFVLDRVPQALYLKYSYDPCKKYPPNLYDFQPISPGEIYPEPKIYDLFIPVISALNNTTKHFLNEIYTHANKTIRIKVGSEDYSDFIRSIASSKIVLNFGQFPNRMIYYLGLSCENTLFVSTHNPNPNYDAVTNIHFVEIQNCKHLLHILPKLLFEDYSKITEQGHDYVLINHNAQTRSEYLIKILKEAT